MNVIQFCDVIGNEIMETFWNEYEDIDDDDDVNEFIDEFLMTYGNNENSIDLLSEGRGYYYNETLKNWDMIIDILDEDEMLNDVEPKNMKVSYIFKKVLYLICQYLRDDMEVVIKN